MPSICLPAPNRRALWLLTGALLALVVLGLAPGRALASRSQVTILQDDPHMLSNAYGTMMKARQLGVTVVRLLMRWQNVAPRANSFHAPHHFNAANPAAYPESVWARYDAVVKAARDKGIRLDLDVAGGAPLWATGRGMPHQSGYPFHNWRPSAADYGKFLRAVATRYSGNYDPVTHKLAPGNSADLPRVSFWSVYNEPNYGPSLAPQSVPGHTNLPESPRDYRALIDQAWNALRATGHGTDTLLIGELAPRGNYLVGTFNMTAPLIFLRALYCVNSSYRPLRGHAAQAIGCPTSAAGSRRFPARNPVLFRSAGISDHPYMSWFPPNREPNQGAAGFRQMLPNYASLAVIGNLVRGVRRAFGAYHSHRAPRIWMTEFGYQTDPPSRPTATAHSHYPSPAVAAYYDNWAEYLTWRNSALASFDQYILQDPPKPRDGRQGYNSGLITARGTPKPGYAAFRMPLYLPRTTASSSSHALEVWGGARPAHFSLLDLPGVSQRVTVLFARKGSSSFTPVAFEPIRSGNGYFDAHVKFPSSGTVKLQWTYPNDAFEGNSGVVIYSRNVSVTVR